MRKLSHLAIVMIACLMLIGAGFICVFAESHTHDWDYTGECEPYNDTQHYWILECGICGETKKELDNHDLSTEPEGDCVKYNNTKHYQMFECMDCETLVKVYSNHNWEKDGYEKYNNTKHYAVKVCKDCGATKKVSEEHRFVFDKITKKATPSVKGKKQYRCKDCGQIKKTKKSFSWRYGKSDSVNYDLTHNYIFRNSKTVKVKLKNGLKGAVVKVKIGKKTYSQKLTNSNKTVKVNIKGKKKEGQKVKITLTYKGKVIGKDICDDTDVVWYDKVVRVGMTKKQCKYISTWGTPDQINKSAYSEQWCFDWDGDGLSDGFLYFNNKGKLTNWQTRE